MTYKGERERRGEGRWDEKRESGKETLSQILMFAWITTRVTVKEITLRVLEIIIYQISRTILNRDFSNKNKIHRALFSVQIYHLTQPVEGDNFLIFEAKKEQYSIYACDIIFTSKKTSSLDDQYQKNIIFFLKINTEAFSVENKKKSVSRYRHRK